MQFLNLEGLQTLWTNILAKLNLKVDKTTKINGKVLNGDITLSATDVNALPASTQLKDLTQDTTHRTVTDAEKATWNAKSDFSGDYNDLTNKPSIPSITGLATEKYVNDAISGIEIPDVPVQSVNGKTGKVQLTAENVGALPNTTVIPDSLSDLSEDATHRTVTDTEKKYLEQKV